MTSICVKPPLEEAIALLYDCIDEDEKNAPYYLEQIEKLEALKATLEKEKRNE